ncbi:MAG: tetratricopeptide repeat protein [Bacteroidales bacterium]|nr:tetratricopeptide repeat protein [Bacteroidales bacterium]
MNKNLFKKAKYIILIKLAIKLVIVLIAVMFNSSAKAQDADTFYFKAMAELEYGNENNALENINQAVNIEKRNENFVIFRGNIYLKQSKYNLAIADFQKAERLKQNSANLLIAKTYSLKNNADSAVYFLTKYLKSYDKISKSEIKLDPAFDNIEETKQWNDLWTKNQYSNVESDYSEAKYLYDFDKPLEALENLNQIIDSYKSFHKAYYLKALILAQNNNYKDAVKALDNAIKYSSNNANYYLLRADYFAILKKWNNSLSDYEATLNYNPLLVEVYYKIALVYAQKNMYITALENINYYTNIFYQNTEALFDEAKINYDAGNFLQTIKIMNKLIEAKPANAEYYSLRGKAFLSSNSFDLAFNDLAQALDYNPKQTDNYYYMGIANLLMDNTNEACANWEKSLENKDYKANEYYYKHCKEYDKAKKSNK